MGREQDDQDDPLIEATRLVVNFLVGLGLAGVVVRFVRRPKPRAER